MANRCDVDERSCEGKTHHLGYSGSHDPQLHRSTGVTAQRQDSVVGGPPAGRLAGHLDDQVASFDTGLFGGGVRERRDDGDPPVVNLDSHANPDVIAKHTRSVIHEFVWVQEVRIWISQAPEHTLRRQVVQLSRVQGVHVIIGKQRDYAVEQYRLLVDPGRSGGRALKQPASGQEGHEAHHDEERDRTGVPS